MTEKLAEGGCLYQDDVVDHLVRGGAEGLLRENSEGNLVLGVPLLSEFRRLTPESVVWVKADRFWRYRVEQDEPGRDARG